MPKNPTKEQLLHSLLQQDSVKGVEVKEISPEKGRGVFTTETFKKGRVVCFYGGELITKQEGLQRETHYALGGNYLFYFNLGSKSHCIDANCDSGDVGRLINHSITDANLKPEAALIDNKATVYFVCKEDIQCGSELLYDYGDRRKEVLEKEPWLARSAALDNHT